MSVDGYLDIGNKKFNTWGFLKFQAERWYRTNFAYFQPDNLGALNTKEVKKKSV